MKNSKVLLLAALALLSISNPTGLHAQDEEINEEELLNEPEAEDGGDVSFDDFEKTQSGAPADEIQDEFGLEPLKEDENQVSEPPPAAAPPAVQTPAPPPPAEEPQEMQPEPVISQPNAPYIDQPDLDYEARLYNIYINYQAKKISPEEWSQLVGQRESEIYRIQPGDNLWKISKAFFNDGNYWPKIWQLNSSIDNPHLIQPGNVIRFLLGTESDSPAFAVTEAPPEPAVEESPPSPAEGLSQEEMQMPLAENEESALIPSGSGTPTEVVEIPGPTEQYPPVLKMVPPSLPEWTNQRSNPKYDNAGIDYGRRPILDLQENKHIESFIDEDSQPTEGSIYGIEGPTTTAAKYQHVFVAFPPGVTPAGQIYTVTKKTGKIEAINKEIVSKELGWQYQNLGEIKILEQISSLPGKEKEPPKNIFRALVINSWNLIDAGAGVIAGRTPTYSLSSQGEKKNVVSQIIAGGNTLKQSTFNLHTVAFLSAGRRDGLNVGDMLTVRANTRLRRQNTSISESYLPVGVLKVVKISERFASAVVVKMWDTIMVGDLTGEGVLLPPLAKEELEKSKAAAQAASASANPAAASDNEAVDDADDSDDSNSDEEELSEDDLDEEEM